MRGKTAPLAFVALSLALDVHELGVHELLQVKRQRRARDVEHRGQRARRHALGAGADQGTKGAQAGLLGQGCQGSDGGFLIHISNYMEI